MNGIRLPRAILAVGAVLLALPLRAATRTVTSTNDSGPGTLRAAILASADNDSIVFDSSIIFQTITLTSGEIDINASISMTGGVTLSGNSASRIFKIAAGKTASLQALTFTGGLARGADGAAGVAGGPGFGGAIWNRGTLHLLSCTFDVDQARGGNSAINPSGAGGGGGTASGGAIYNDSGATLDISSCEFDNDSASGGTGGPGTPGGVGGNAFGGAIWSEGNVLTISGSRFIGDTASGGGGGISNGNGGNGAGGAVWTADQQFSLSDATFMTNLAGGGFGDDSGTGLGGNAAGGALLVESDTAPTIDRSQFDGNSANAGATNTDIGRWGTARGGAISLVGDLTIRTSTLSNNSAQIHSEGGAIFASGSLAVTNCTITGNTAAEGFGGGLSSDQASTLTNVTISANHADSGGGGIHITGNPTTIVNTIVAKNTTSGADPDGQIGSVSVVSGGHNVIGVAFGGVLGGSFTAGAGDQIGTSGTPLDPGLAALANVGGPTATMALELTSPALDHGGDASCPATDQTTETTRPQGAHCDVGAYELKAIGTGKAGSDAFTLTVAVTGPGHVTSTPSAGIGCPAACADAYFPGTAITLTATPAAGAKFAGWSGACAGVGSTAPVTLNSNLSCGAAFTAPGAAVPTAGPGALAGLALLLGMAGWTVLRKM